MFTENRYGVHIATERLTAMSNNMEMKTSELLALSNLLIVSVGVRGK
jgi:hypothetical protein